MALFLYVSLGGWLAFSASRAEAQFRYSVIGDYGDNDADELLVANRVQAANPNFIITVGDNNYQTIGGGSRAQILNLWDVTQRKYYGFAIPDPTPTFKGNPTLGTASSNYYAGLVSTQGGSTFTPPPINKMFLAPGNHDWDVGDLSDASLNGLDRIVPYTDYFSLPGRGVNAPFRNTNERYYSFTQGSVTDALGTRPLVQVFITDSDPRNPDDGESVNSGSSFPSGAAAVESSAEGQWLKRALNASNAVYKVVSFHHPAYVSSDHDSDFTRRLPYDTWGATSVLQGHVHASEIIEKPTSVPGMANLPYFVVGEGGRDYDPQVAAEPGRIYWNYEVAATNYNGLAPAFSNLQVDINTNPLSPNYLQTTYDYIRASDGASMFTYNVSAPTYDYKRWNAVSNNGVWDTTSTNWINPAGTTGQLFVANGDTIYSNDTTDGLAGDRVLFNSNLGGAITVASAVRARQIAFTHDTGTYSFSGSPIMGPLVKTGTGEVELNSANNFTSVSVSAGTLRAFATNALGAGGLGVDSTSNSLTITGGTVVLGATQSLASAQIHGGSNGAGGVGTGVLETRLSGAIGPAASPVGIGDGGTWRLSTSPQAHANPVSLFGDGTIENNVVGTTTLSGGVTGVYENVQLTGTGTDGQLTGQVSTYGSVLKTGTGRWTLASNSNNGVFGSVIVGQGTLAIAGTTTINNSPTVLVDSGATLDVSGRTEGAGGLMTLATGQTLKGSGAVTGLIRNGAGAAIGPGSAAAAGTLTFNNGLSLNGGQLNFKLSNTTTVGGGVNDFINVIGNLDMGGIATTIHFSTLTTLTNGTYDLIHHSNPLVLNPGSFTVGTQAPGSGTYSIVQTPGVVSLVLSGYAPPMPATPGILTSFEVPLQGATTFTAAGGEIGWTRTTTANNPHAQEGVRQASLITGGEFASLLTAPDGADVYLSRSANSSGMAEVLTFDPVVVTAGQMLRIRYGVSTTSWEADDKSIFTYTLDGSAPITLKSIFGTSQLDAEEGGWKTATSAPFSASGTLVLSWSTSTNSSAAAEGVLLDFVELVAPPKTLTWNTHPAGTWNSGVSGNNVWQNSSPAADFFNHGDTVVFSQAAAPTSITVAAGGVTANSVTVSHTSGTYTFTGAGITGPLMKQNSGDVVFSNTSNNFGDANISGGTATFDNATTFNSLTVSGGTAVLKAANSIGGGTTISGSGIVEARITGALGAGALSLNGGTLKGNTGSAITLANAWSLNAINGGTIDVAAGTVLTMSGALSATGSNSTTQTLYKTGDGTLSLTSATAFGGTYLSQNLYVQGGTLRLQHAGDVLSTQTIVNISAGAVVDESWDNGETMGGLAGGGSFWGRHAFTAGGGITLNANSNFSGTITAGTNGVIDNAATQAGANTRNVDLHVASGATVSLTGNTSPFAGRVFVDNGTLNFSNVDNRGFDKPSALGNGNVASSPISAGTDIVLGTGASAATLAYTGTTLNATDRTITLSGTGAAAIGVTSSTGTLRLNGVINSTATPSSFTKTGAGTLDLREANTYAGNTTVGAGTLLVNNTTGSATGAGNVTVQSGATLGGAGIVSGGVTIQAGGNLSPGNSIGTMTVGGPLNLAGTYQVQMGTPGVSHAAPGLADRTNVNGSGNISLGGTLNLVDNAGADGNGSVGAGSYQIFTYTGALTGSFATVTGPNASLHPRVVDAGAGTGSGQGVFVDLYRLAAANAVSPGSTNFGTVLVGTPLSQNLTVTNTAAADGFSENLNATIGSPTGNATTNGGTITGLAAGATNNTGLSIGINTSTAGAKLGSAQITLNSNGTGSSGFGDTALSGQNVSASAVVLDGARASFTTSGVTTTLNVNLGTFTQNSGTHSSGYSISNLLQTLGFTANLDLDTLSLVGADDPNLSTNLATFTGLAPGSNHSFLAMLDTMNTGTFNEQYLLQLNSSTFSDALQTLTLNIGGTVQSNQPQPAPVPEPAAIALWALMGLACFGWQGGLRFWRKRAH